MSQNNVLARIQQLENMGWVNGQLAALYSLQHDAGNFFAMFLRRFYRDVSNDLQRIEDILTRNGYVANFQELSVIAHNLHTTAASVGAVQIGSACRELWVASRDQSTQGCLNALDEIATVYFNLKEHLDEILQML